MFDQQWEDYCSSPNPEVDFDEFWKETKHQSVSQPLQILLKDLHYPIPAITSKRLYYQGFGGGTISAYYLRPEGHKGKLPCLIVLHGYGGNKGAIADYAKYVMLGFAVLAMDIRGHGESGNISYPVEGSGSWVTQGILDPKSYYYRHVYMDVIRMMDIAEEWNEEIDSSRIIICGGSMGGGIAMAVAGLDQRPAMAIADVPNMCDIPLAIQLKVEGSLVYVERFLRHYPEKIDQVFRTLSYFDNKNLAGRISCPIHLSAAGKDLICPPQTIFGVYQLINAEKEIFFHPFAGHDLPGTTSHKDRVMTILYHFLNRKQ